jgi:hypothetical protein
MNNQTFLQIQAAELRRLLQGAGDDPIVAPQLRERLAEVERDLKAISTRQVTLLPKESVILPRAAIFLRGGGVQDSEGIRPILAGEALIQYEKMFIEQALHDEREAARKAGRQRRPRGASTPGLLFTGTPRGSFGLEFVPQATEDGYLEVHAQSLRNVADAIVLVAESDSKSLDETIKSIPSRVLQPLKQFMKTLSQYEAEVRLAFPDRPARSLSVENVRIAADRLEREVHQETVEISGVFRGVTRESGVFDLRTDLEDVITGTVADYLTEDDLERIDTLTNMRCKAKLQETTIRSVAGISSPSYVLLEAEPYEEPVSKLTTTD